MKLNIFKFLFGYIEFDVIGADAQTFISEAMHNNIDLWSITRRDACTVRAKSRYLNLDAVKKACVSSGNELRMISSRGLPVVFSRYKNRIGILAGIIIFICIITYMSSFIWKIELTGDYTAEQKCQILDILEQNGCKIGSSIGSQNEQLLKYAILRSTTVAYATVNLHGTVLSVEINKSIKTPDMYDSKSYCNIIASDDGIITCIRSYNGVTEVKRGQAVKKGQLLVNGIYNSKIMGARLVHAHAKVEAEVLQTLSVNVDYNQKTKVYTGKKSSFYYIELFGHRINLSFKKQSPFENFITDTVETPLVIGKNNTLPIIWGKCVYSEIGELDVVLSKDDAILRGIAELDEMERIQLCNAQILSREQQITDGDNGIIVEYIYNIIKDIGEEQPVYQSNETEEN